MNLIAQWKWRRTVQLVEQALGAGHPARWIAVVGPPSLAKVLKARGHQVLALAESGRALGKLAGHAAKASPRSLPLVDEGVAAVVGVDACLGPQDLLTEWCRAVIDGGVLVFVDKAPREELTRRALVLGLKEIEQRSHSGTVVTSGRVHKLLMR
ncbi:MAG: hypothetical protein HY698_12050 [Deltaproteobacteria bacterium]|nr:hypothetical protein [Deltaproteobacteria bacterium]